MSTTEKDEGFAVVCTLVKEQDTPHPGSTKQRCAECDEQVWASPRSTAAIERAKREQIPARIVCGPCLVMLATADPELKKELQKQGLSSLPGAKAELTEMLGEDYANHAYSVLDVTEHDPFGEDH